MNKSWYKWEVLALLWVAFFLNQADRQIYNTLLGQISTDMAMTSEQAGLIATLFSLIMAISMPIFGFAADRISKKWLIVFAVLLWSVATMVTGFATGILMFIIFRCVATGLGEGAFSSANYATIADYHDKDTRATAMSIHQTSYYLGVIVTGGLASWLCSIVGWRWVFAIFGGLGIILGGIIILRLKDKVKVVPIEKKSEIVKEKVSLLESVKLFFTIPTVICLTFAYAGLIFVLQGYLTWSTVYLQEKFKLDLVEAGFGAVFYTHIAALLGVLVAGRISDKVASKKSQYRMLLQGMGLLLASPFIAMMGLSTNVVLAFVGFAGFGFWRSFFDANTYAVLYDVVPKKYHASATGISLFLGWSIGSLAPLILGMMKTRLNLELSTSIASLSIIWFFFSFVLFFAFKFFYARDYNRANEYNLKN